MSNASGALRQESSGARARIRFTNISIHGSAAIALSLPLAVTARMLVASGVAGAASSTGQLSERARAGSGPR